MRSVELCSFVLLAFAALAVRAEVAVLEPATLKLAVEVPSISDSRILCRLHIESLEAASEEGLELALEAPAELVLEPPGPPPWKLSLQTAEAFWAAEKVIHLEEGSSREILSLLPAGTLTGRLVDFQGARLPAELALRLRALPEKGARSEASLAETYELRCPVTHRAWSCKAPAGSFDLRVEVEGYVPHYYWKAQLAPSETIDLGPSVLTKGASLAGWVEVVGGERGAEAGVEIELAPRVMGYQVAPAEAERIALRGYRTQTNDRGFFQIPGVAPGGYQLRARRQGFSARGEIFADITESRETLLERPIVLETHAALELFLDPPADPYGQPWSVTVFRQRSASSVLQKVGQQRADETGFWSQGGLEGGTYRISIADSTRAIWLDEPLEVTAGDGPRQIEIPIVPVEGRIRIGDEPLEATVVFGTTQRRPSIHAASDEEGIFEAFLPREGEWQLEVLPEHDFDRLQAVEAVEVEREPGQRAAFVEVSLPDTLVRGRVVEGETPVARAGILVIRDDGGSQRREAMIASQADGSFELRGLSPGRIQARARHGRRFSEWKEFEIQENLEGPELVLDLAEKVTVRGRLLSPAGAVAGANVAALPVTPRPDLAELEHTVTTADGSFSLQLPSGTRQADLLVTAAGWPIRLVREGIDPSRPLSLVLPATGGDLTLGELPSEPAADGSVRPLLLRYEGAEMDVRWLLRWIDLARQGGGEGRLIFRGLAPGTYELCRIGGSCASGSLAAGGDLTLTTVSR